MSTKPKAMNIISAVFLFGAVATGCGGSPSAKSFGSVGQADITGYEIRNLPDTINVGDVVQAHAWAIFDDGSEVDFTLGLVWQTSNPNVAALDPLYNPGLVIGVSPGQARISATDGEIEGYKDITVQ